MAARSTIEVDELDDRIVVRVAGEVDLSNTDEFARAVGDAMDRTTQPVVIDVTSVRYMDSAALRTFWKLAEAEDARGQQLRIVAPFGSPARQLLDLVDAGQFLKLIDSAATSQL